jgi:hypothetical protein
MKTRLQLSKPRDTLDLNDPFDGFACLFSGIFCENCGAMVEQDAGFDGCDDASLCNIADKAKAQAWYMVGNCFCPDCAKKKGLK